MDKLLYISENAIRKRLMGMFMSIWKARYAISIKNRKINEQEDKLKKES